VSRSASTGLSVESTPPIEYDWNSQVVVTPAIALNMVL